MDGTLHSGRQFSLIITDKFFCLIDISQTLMPEVSVVQRCVVSALCKQAIVISLLNNTSLFHYNDSVCRLHGG